MESKPERPKRRIKCGSLEGNATVSKVAIGFNQSALSICRLNILSATGRTQLERLRYSSMSANNLFANNPFEDKPDCRSFDKERCFIQYASYWLGILLELRYSWAMDKKFDAKEWDKLVRPLMVFEAIAEMGLDVVNVTPTGGTQKFTVVLSKRV